MAKLCALALPARLLVLSLNDAIASSSTRERSAAARASMMRACSIDDDGDGDHNRERRWASTDGALLSIDARFVI